MRRDKLRLKAATAKKRLALLDPAARERKKGSNGLLAPTGPWPLSIFQRDQHLLFHPTEIDPELDHVVMDGGPGA